MKNLAICFAICLLSLFPFSTSFAEQADLDKVEELFAEGKLDQASAILEDMSEHGLTGGEMARLYMFKGIFYLAKGYVEKAEEMFRVAIRSKPDFLPSREKYSADILQLFEQQRSWLLGSVSITTEPPGADAFLNDELFGRTPLVVNDLPEGEYRLRLYREKYQQEVRRVVVSPSVREYVFAELRIDDRVPPEIIHTIGGKVRSGATYRVAARVADNVRVRDVLLYYRSGKEFRFSFLPMLQKEEGVYEGVIPSAELGGEKLQYYIHAADFNENTGMSGTPASPYEVPILEVDAKSPVIIHTPLKSTSDASHISVKAEIIDDSALGEVIVGFRKGGETGYMLVNLPVTESGRYVAEIPDVFLSGDFFEYYIEARDKAGNRQFSGRPEEPHVVPVYKVRPYSEGFVAERADEKSREVTLGIGLADGKKEGDEFTVFRIGERVTDPVTGEVLKIDQIFLGRVRVTSVSQRTSTAKIVSENRGNRIRANDMIRSHPSIVKLVRGVSVAKREVELSWAVNPEPETAGYLVYRSENATGPYEKIATLRGRDRINYQDKEGWRNKLEDGKPYYYRVAAFGDEREEGPLSEAVKVVTKGGPNPPSELNAVSNEVGRISLFWSRSRDPETAGYVIERAATKDGPYMEIFRIRGAASVSHIHMGTDANPLEDGKKYFFRILSYNPFDKTGNPSDPVEAHSMRKPPSPSGFGLLAEGVKRITLKWDMHVFPEVEGYILYRSPSKDGGYAPVKRLSDKSITEYMDDGGSLEDGKTYYYMLSAYATEGLESERVGPIEGKTATPPSSPTAVKASQGKVKHIELSWEYGGTESVAGYAIYRSVDEEDFREIKRIFGRENTRYTDRRGLEDGRRYFYRVVSINIMGMESPPAEAVQGFTKAPPAKPKELLGTSGEARRTHLVWQANPETDIKEYRIWRSTDPDKGFSIAGRVSAEKTEFNDLYLRDGKQYYYRISAYDEDGLESQPSGTIFIVTRLLPSPPAFVEAEPGTTSIVLRWTASPESNIEYYNIYTKGVLAPSLTGMTPDTAFVVDGLKPGTDMTFFITAVDDTGLESEASHTVSVKTLKE